MRYVVIVDHEQRVRVMPVGNDSVYWHPAFLCERAIYTYGEEHAAVANAATPEEARTKGLQVLREHFPSLAIRTTRHPSLRERIGRYVRSRAHNI